MYHDWFNQKWRVEGRDTPQLVKDGVVKKAVILYDQPMEKAYPCYSTSMESWRVLCIKRLKRRKDYKKTCLTSFSNSLQWHVEQERNALLRNVKEDVDKQEVSCLWHSFPYWLWQEKRQPRALLLEQRVMALKKD